MKWEILVVTIHVGGVSVGKSLVEGYWTLDCFVLGVQHLRYVTLQLVTFRLNVFNCEADDCASNLHGHSMLGFQS